MELKTNQPRRKYIEFLGFFDTITDMENKTKILYHGSQHKITDGVIYARDAYLPTTNTPITAVFATPDFAHAKNYACMRLIADGWKSPRTSDTLYVQKLSQDISGKKAYIYELDSDGFECDTDGTYYSLTDKPIKRVIEIDVMQEIMNGNIKVYVLKPGIDCPSERGDIWAELVNNRNNFELYKPVSKNLDMSLLSHIKDLGFNK